MMFPTDIQHEALLHEHLIGMGEGFFFGAMFVFFVLGCIATVAWTETRP